MKRSDIIKKIMDSIPEDGIVVASTGLISREVFRCKDRPLNFYMQGSMGCALSIGIGIALNIDKSVFVISGDGAVLMSLGTMATHRKYNPQNLKHFILDNNCHESTGGQPTASNYVPFRRLAPNTYVFEIDKDPDNPPRIPLKCAAISERFKNAISHLLSQPKH